MDLTEIKAKFDAARVIRVPRLDPNTHMRDKIAKLEEYLTDTAFHRGELEDALWWLWSAEQDLKDQWDKVVGFEPFLPPTASKRTQDAIRQAKRQVAPQLYDGLMTCHRLKDAIGRQIRRLELDDRNVSRTYSLATGS
jgi:hypothetical protein